MNIKKTIMVGLVAAASGAMALDYVEVTDVKARQRYPWNGLVDIDFQLDSKATEPYQMQVTVVDNVGKTNLPVKTVYTEGISFKENPCMVHKDTSRILWDAAADLPDGFKCTNVLVTCQDTRSMGISNLYMIVDLSGGTAAEKFAVTYTNCPPRGGWTEEHMTTKLVLRRVDPGAFLMGSPFSENGRNSNEAIHEVVLTRPYYIGVYEVSQKQMSLIYGGGGADTRPAKIGWSTLRGEDVSSGCTHSESSTTGKFTLTITQTKASTDYSWPISESVDPNSFMGRLRFKTGLAFDIPTEAEWEKACRSGSALELNVGMDDTDENVKLIRGDAKLDPTETHYIYGGNYMPNAIGLYDMQGNDGEWCLDVYKDDLAKLSAEDPVGGDFAYEGKELLNGKYFPSYYESKISFNGKSWSTPDYTDRYVKYTAYGVRRVVKGGATRVAYRSSALNLNTKGIIFTEGVTYHHDKLSDYIPAETTVKKAAYTNPEYAIRVVVRLEK